MASAAADGTMASDYAALATERPTMEKQVKSSVDYYTGTANVNVSLYTVSSYGFNIPISVQYTASGLKTDVYPTTVGLNWKLTGTGRISRFVNGQPDETGFLDGHGALAANSTASEWKNSAISSKIEDKFDGEPDLYYFELPSGLSGMFVINYDKTIALIPYQDVKVEWMNNTDYANSYFVITDAQGMKYNFGSTADSRDKAYNKDYERTKTYVSGWMLDNISFGGKQIARYSYATSASYEKGFWNYLYRFEYKPATNAHKSLTTTPINVITTVYPKVLTSITWDLGKLEFDHGSADNTVRTGPYLRNIRVYGYNNEYLKTIHFELGWFATTLDRIYETSGDLRRTICSFQYFYSPTNFPNRNTYSIDYWGYFNGAYLTGPVYPAHTILGYNVAGVSRTASLECTKYRSLQKIIYPSGGWTEFEYELHQGRLPTPNVQNEWNGPLETAGGLRIKSITHCESGNAVPSTTQYIYQDPADTKKGGQIFSSYKPYARIRYDGGSGSNRVVIYSITKRPDFQMTDFTGSSVVYNYVKEVLPNGAYTVYEYNSFNNCMDVKGEAALSASGGIGSYATDTQDKVPYTTKFFGRGTLSKMTQYNSAAQPVYSESYTYSQSFNPQKAVVYSYPLFTTDEESSVKYYKGRYQWISQPVVLTKKTITNPEPYSEMNFSYHSSYDDLFPRAIETRDAMANYYRATITYPQDYAIDITSLPKSAQTYGIGWLKANGVRSTPIETIKYRRNVDEPDFNVIGGSLNLYNWSPVAQRCLLSETKSLLVNTPLGTAITPLSVVNGTTLVKDSRYDQYNSKITDFNDKGNPTFISDIGITARGTQIIYGYNGLVPIAHVKGAVNESNGFYTSFEEDASGVAVLLGNRAKSGNYALNKNTSYRAIASTIGGPHVLSYWRWNGTEGTDWEEVRTSSSGSSVILEPNHYVDEVRLMPVKASMTTQVVKPGVGIISAANENGRVTRNNYNSLGMLESVEDDGRIVEKYSYIDGSDIFNLSASVDGGSSGRGHASVNPVQVGLGGSATFTATPNPGYQFSQWQFNDGTSSYASVTVKDNIRFNLTGTASFTAVQYNLSAVVGSGSTGRGQVSVTPALVNAGGSATWSATAYNGYAFSHWSFSDGTTATTPSVTKTGISQNITGTAHFTETGPQSVNFYGTIMPRNGYWAIHISCTPDIISEGVQVYATGYFFINPYEPDERDAQFDGQVGEDGYVLSNTPFDENNTVGKLNGTISISSTKYKVGTVSWN